jgi:hypothetical protein
MRDDVSRLVALALGCLTAQAGDAEDHSKAALALLEEAVFALRRNIEEEEGR